MKHLGPYIECALLLTLYRRKRETPNKRYVDVLKKNPQGYERGKMKCLTEVCEESAAATPGGKSGINNNKMAPVQSKSRSHGTQLRSIFHWVIPSYRANTTGISKWWPMTDIIYFTLLPPLLGQHTI